MSDSVSPDCRPEMTDQDKEALKKAGVSSTEELCARIANDPGFLETVRFPDDFGSRRVAEAVGADALDLAKRITSRRVFDHTADVVLVALVALFVFAVARKGLRAPAAPAPTPAVIVAAAQGIEPFHAIAPSDVKRTSTTDPAPRATINEVVGRYSVDRIAKDAYVDPAKLGSLPVSAAELGSWRLLQVSFDGESTALGLKPPMKIALAAASPAGKADPSVVVEDVYLLKVRSQGDHVVAVIATTAENVARLAPFVGTRLSPVLAWR